MHSLLPPNIISFRHGKTLFISFLFCSAFTFNVLGQQEGTGVHSDFPVVNEEISERDGPIKEKEVAKTPTPKENYKTHEEKETKNGGMSTLSFNLFLYVADRFKENK